MYVDSKWVIMSNFLLIGQFVYDLLVSNGLSCPYLSINGSN